MYRRKPSKAAVCAIAIGVTLLIVTISGLVGMRGFKDYAGLDKPPLSPPAWLFPVAWSLLYVLMGISAARVYLAGTPYTKEALSVYCAQLLVNALWTPIFFALELRLVAFVWLLLLIVLVVMMIAKFKKADPIAGNLQFPYLIWLLFAAYLNMGAFILNR